MNREIPNEIEPPWIKYPGHLPGDVFWRQSGEIWFLYVWRPYYDSLSDTAKDAYLKRWDVPTEWKQFYFDPDFQKWLDSVDDM